MNSRQARKLKAKNANDYKEAREEAFSELRKMCDQGRVGNKDYWKMRTAWPKDGYKNWKK